MRKIIITGATSFIGLRLIACLLRENHIFAIVRPGSPKIAQLPSHENLSVVELDMDDYARLPGSIPDGADAFIHLAWNGTRGADRNNYEMQEHNYRCSLAALQSAIDLKTKIFMSAGSQAEYGPQFTQNKITEECKARPNTEYGIKKLAFYKAAAAVCHDAGVRFIEPRFFSLYGPHDFEGTMIVSMLRKMLKNETCDLTAAVQTWDFLFIEDAIAGLKMLLDDENTAGVYNFGSGESAPLRSFIEKMKEITRSDSQLNFGAMPYPPTGMVNLNPCVDKLKSLGWRPRVNFAEGIAKVIAGLGHNE